MRRPTQAHTRHWNETGYLVFSDALKGEELRRRQTPPRRPPTPASEIWWHHEITRPALAGT